MPLPNDEKLLKLSEDVLAQFDTLFGLHPGFRPAHAKGILLQGSFTPTPAASQLSSAQHLNQPQTPVLARYSDATGIPQIPDTDPNARPWGFAVRFVLAEHLHTDIVAHSTDGFPTRTGAEFLKAIAASDPAHLAGSPLEAFLGSHPAALRFVQAPKPLPASFANESFYGVTAMQFTNAAGASRFGRYRILPEAGPAYLDDAAASAKDPNYLFTELPERLAKSPVRLKIQLQLANPGDVVDDATIAWPEDRELVDLGTLTLTAPVASDAQSVEQKHLIFDPIPRLAGIAPSADPLLELRAAIYLLSGRRRRSA
ncbi:MAG TPA: catalase family peroxidase [Granulicella sp.]|nr:catalase family peroxidase [Granulicella sp.]